MNETIHDIAAKHGVLLSKDDPILILHTMNEKLLEENRRSQQEMLAQYKEEMEYISSGWRDDAKEKAEKILNTALASSKEAMARLLQESTNETTKLMKKMILEALDEAHELKQQSSKSSRLALLISTALLASSFVLMMSFLIQN